MKKYRFHAIIFVALMVMSTISIVVGYVSGLLQQEQQLAFHSKLPYEYCYRFEGDDYTSNSFVDLNATYSAKAEMAIKCDKIMQVHVEYPTDSVWGNIPMLQSNEVSISLNLLKLHNLDIGDSISVQSPNAADPVYYKISSTFEPCYGLYNDFVETSRGVIIFGFDRDYLEKNTTGFITYQHTEFKPSEITSQLIGLFSINDQVQYVLADLMRTIALIWCIQLITDVIGSFFLYERYKSYLQRLYCFGMNGRQTISKLFQTIMFPFFICRGIIFLVGAIMFFINGEYVIWIISLAEIILLIAISVIQEKLIKRGV